MFRSPLRLAFFLIPLALAFFAVLPLAQAQLPSPSPDGGYPGNNTAEGDGALSSVQFTGSPGFGNTAIGSDALHNNTFGNANTATGWEALLSTTSGFENTATGAVALQNNTGGIQNTATGQAALQNNNDGSYNSHRF